MGKHYHYRVCVRGEKDHSSGGEVYGWLKEWIDEREDNLPLESKWPVMISWNHRDYSWTDVVIFMICRHKAHYNRTVKAILFATTDKGTGKPILNIFKTNMKFDLRNPKHEYIYRTLEYIYKPDSIVKYGVSQIDPDKPLNDRCFPPFTRELVKGWKEDGMSEDEIYAALMEL